MKKSVVLFVVLISLHFSVKSQYWCPPGAKWHYAWKAGGLNLDGMVSYEYVKDTTIQGNVSKQIIGTFYGIWDPVMGSKNIVTIPNFRKVHTYESNKVIYAFNGITFDTIVNYRANKGDKWLQFGRRANCNNMTPVVVIDTGQVTINNLSLRKIVLSYSVIIVSGAFPQTVTHTYTMVEKLSNTTSIYTFADLIPTFCDETGGISENPTTSFSCYEDLQFPLYEITPLACKNVLGVESNNFITSPFDIYPNPNSGNFIISISQPCRVSILNAQGQMVMEKYLDKVGENQLDIFNMPNGLYLISVSMSQGISNKMFIKD